jgi:hypothetical protein
MATLRETLLTDEKRPAVMSDALELLDAEVARKSGVSGFAVKKGYNTVKRFKPGFLEKVVDDLIPKFCDALEPLHEEHMANDEGKRFGERMRADEERVTAALLGVTDGLAEGSTNRPLKKMYAWLRPAAERNVRDAIPGLSELMDKHYGA